MKFTKLEHSGCVIENNGNSLICDPVEIKQKLPEMQNVLAIIITHQHGDHFQPAVLERILNDNPKAQVFVPQDFEASSIPSHPITQVTAGVEYNLEDFNLKFFGKDHASIIPGQVPCANIGVVVNDVVANPGDSFDQPGMIDRPKLLLVPSAAPWLKIYESVEYIKATKPEIVVPVHNAILSEFGNGISNNWLKTICEEMDIRFAALLPGESIKI